MVKMGLRKSIVLTLAIVSALTAGGQAVLADSGSNASLTTTPLTAAPPAMVQPLAIYSGYTYLLASSIAMQDNTGFFRISVTTQAKSTVSLVGASVQLQRYTGTNWIDVGSSTNLTASNTDLLSSYVDKTTLTGYYYRAKVTHYVTHGSTHESVVEYSTIFLAS